MKYEAHYARLIERARKRVLTGYAERHHVVPRCMGGGDEPCNLVDLTPEEHYVAHQLLVKMHPGIARLVFAAMFMSKQCTGNKPYGWLRRRHAAALRGQKRGPMSAETRAKIGAANSTKRRPPELRARISVALRGRKTGPFSVQHRANISSGSLGKKGTNTGKTFPPQWRANMSAALKGREILPESRVKIADAKRGIPLSENTRAKMSAAHRKVWADRRARVAAP